MANFICQTWVMLEIRTVQKVHVINGLPSTYKVIKYCLSNLVGLQLSLLI